jgi:hypothetical protein
VRAFVYDGTQESGEAASWLIAGTFWSAAAGRFGFCGVRRLDAALDLLAFLRLVENQNIQSGVKPPHSKKSKPASGHCTTTVSD